MGPPGVGKGTQAELLCKKFHLQHLSTGHILRSSVEKKTSLGLKAKEYMNQGRLVPDSLMIQIVEEALPSKDFILDGFPRTIPQAEALDQLLMKKNISLTRIFLLVLPEKELIKRITGRRCAPTSGRVYHIDFNPPKKKGICDESGEKLIQREDDQEAAVRIRLKTNEDQQQKLNEYYGLRIQSISAEGNVQSIHQRLLDFISTGDPKHP